MEELVKFRLTYAVEMRRFETIMTRPKVRVASPVSPRVRLHCRRSTMLTFNKPSQLPVHMAFPSALTPRQLTRFS